MNIAKAESYLLAELERRLPADLFYHGLHHTLDVRDAAMRLAAQEGLQDDEMLALVQTAALYHDSGFLKVYQAHEEEGCRIAQEVLPRFDYTSAQIEQICSMIMATKIPQQPQSLAAEILCDADLDYLGRQDFEPVAATLFKELKTRSLIADQAEWDRIQVRFLETHQYWTNAARRERGPVKATHLAALKARQ